MHPILAAILTPYSPCPHPQPHAHSHPHPHARAYTHPHPHPHRRPSRAGTSPLAWAPPTTPSSRPSSKLRAISCLQSRAGPLLTHDHVLEGLRTPCFHLCSFDCGTRVHAHSRKAELNSGVKMSIFWSVMVSLQPGAPACSVFSSLRSLSGLSSASLSRLARKPRA